MRTIRRPAALAVAVLCSLPTASALAGEGGDTPAEFGGAPALAARIGDTPADFPGSTRWRRAVTAVCTAPVPRD
jgi:hypothetical protein